MKWILEGVEVSEWGQVNATKGTRKNYGRVCKDGIPVTWPKRDEVCEKKVHKSIDWGSKVSLETSLQ